MGVYCKKLCHLNLWITFLLFPNDLGRCEQVTLGVVEFYAHVVFVLLGYFWGVGPLQVNEVFQ